MASHAPVFMESCYSNGYDSLWNRNGSGSAYLLGEKAGFVFSF